MVHSKKCRLVRAAGLTVLLLLIANSIYAQQTRDSIANNIDKLFKSYDGHQSTPGAVVAILKNDSTLYLKSYGLANIEYNIPNDSKSVYYICSLAKQFTAYSILLLAKENKLHLDDDIRVYLPWMADFGKKITIRNLLHHTSGIRDDLNLLQIAGIGGNGVISQELALNILKRQRTLNFPPGEQMSYSNSNYILLAEIVKAASGKSFRRFTDSAIFQPLHMVNSHFYDNPAEIIPNRAVSYIAVAPGIYQNSPQNVYTLGDGGLFMPMNDMILWVHNFFNNKIGTAKDIELLNEKGKLNSGKEVSNITLTIKGKQVYAYNGGLNGYKTLITISPEDSTGFILFANNGDDHMYDVMYPLADWFIPEKKSVAGAVDATPMPVSTATVTDSIALKLFKGEYMADNSLYFQFDAKEGKLYLKPGQLLVQKTRDTFVYSPNPKVRFVFSAQKKPGEVDLAVITPDQSIQMKKYDLKKKYKDRELLAYTGEYECGELDCKYQIRLKDHRLELCSNKYADSPIDVWNADNLKNDAVLGHFNILRSATGGITGFEINNGSVMHLRFTKIP